MIWYTINWRQADKVEVFSIHVKSTIPVTTQIVIANKPTKLIKGKHINML